MFSSKDLTIGAIVAILFFSFLAIIDPNNRSDKIVGWAKPQGADVAPMPILRDSRPTRIIYGFAPKEDRGAEYRRYLAASLKINVSGASGSGTIIHYDPQTQYAYVISCGHLWSGSKSAEELKNNPVECKVTTWYHNSEKLGDPKQYPAEVLFWSNNRGYDSSLLRFKPDWIPDYFPIASVDYPLPPGKSFHSVGCDGGREVARYEVHIKEMRGADLITELNSPRPGRSGGGLLSSDGYYVAICWGTSDTRSGNGIGYFTPLSAIHKMFKENGFEWLLKGSFLRGRTLPIYDRSNPARVYPQDYLPVPGSNAYPAFR